MPKQFWSEYTQSAGVFSIGEVFNGNPKYVAGYQGSLAATLNYPMYYKLLNAFQHKQSMKNIHNGILQNSVFPDTSVLGNFLDNHDNPRFLSNNGDSTTLKNGLAYVIFAEVGIHNGNTLKKQVSHWNLGTGVVDQSAAWALAYIIFAEIGTRIKLDNFHNAATSITPKASIWLVEAYELHQYPHANSHCFIL